MDLLIKKLDLYDSLNYFFTGVLFFWLLNLLGLRIDFSVTGEQNIDTFFLFFVLYFLGLTISRIGSLILEPILKGLGLLKFEKYSDFLKAEKFDEKIRTLMIYSNLFRCLMSLFFCLLMVSYLKDFFYGDYINHFLIRSLLNFGFILFLCSYVKQSNFIASRVRYFIEQNASKSD